MVSLSLLAIIHYDYNVAFIFLPPAGRPSTSVKSQGEKGKKSQVAASSSKRSGWGRDQVVTKMKGGSPLTMSAPTICLIS